jgi:type IV secretory pathway TrbF-like protein/sugar phosphate permease
LGRSRRIRSGTLPGQAPPTQSDRRPLPPGRPAATAAFHETEAATLADWPAHVAAHHTEAKHHHSSAASIASLRQTAPGQIPRWRLVAFVFLPFAAGYYLSYLFRTVSALIAGPLTSELGLDAAHLGLLTSVYFLSFAAAQIPIGVLLDRYDPRRVQSALLVVASAGAALFAASDRFLLLVIARAMIGFGVAASLTAGLKAVVLWFPRDRIVLVNGCMVMLGALGAVTATAPAERLLDWTGWRGLFELLAAATAVAAGAIFFLVPEAGTFEAKPNAAASLKTVYADSRFWKLAPLSATCVGSAWALQGLWAASWFSDVDKISRVSVITQLFIMAVAVSLGALLLGAIADRLRLYNVSPQRLLAVIAASSIVAQLALILRLPLPPAVSWSVVAVVGAGTVLSYASLAEYFPKEVAGRANGALNVFHLGWAFVVQYATGLILAQWPIEGGHYPLIAYQTAFGLNVAIQIAMLLWFELPAIKAGRSGAPSAIAHRRSSPEPLNIYNDAARVWAQQHHSARARAATWRAAALGSTGLSALLGLALAISISRAEVASFVAAIDHLNESRHADAPAETRSHAQISYFLARFVTNIRSLSTDPVVVRADWTDALSYVTAHDAQVLSEYARDSKPFIGIGVRAVSVEVISIVQASTGSFEIYWKEETYRSGAIIKSERYTGIAAIVIRPTKADPLRNPLGLFVDEFKWRRDGTE